MANVAQTVYLSRAQFARKFSAETGQTFTGFVTACRLQEARKLLAETNWPITAISEVVGMTPAHLRNLFTEHTGMSPGEFRRNRCG